MKQTKRQLAIMNMLQVEKSCSIIDLANKLDVSDETIRRDIKEMAKYGAVEKIHGGVMLPNSALAAPGNATARKTENREAGSLPYRRRGNPDDR